MARVTIYLPDDVARDVRRQARRAKKSVSAYLASLASGEARARNWPPKFLQTFGSWQGELPASPDPPPELAPRR